MEKDTGTHHPSRASCAIEMYKRICMNENGKGAPACPILLKKDVCDPANTT